MSTSATSRALFAAAWWAAVAGCGVAPAPPPPPAPVAAPAAPGDAPPELHRGIDVSGHSGEVDWRQLAAAGHTFAFVKATEGVDLKDPAFDRHWPQIKRAGMLRGAYHFYVTEDDAGAQARFFIDTVDLEPGDLAPVVDLELIGHGTAPGLSRRLRRWLEVVGRHYGVKPIIYTTAAFWDQHVSGDFGDYPLWVAEYDVEAPRLPTGWRRWHLWQWQQDVPLPGVVKGADLSRVNPALDDLSQLLVPPSAAAGEQAPDG